MSGTKWTICLLVFIAPVSVQAQYYSNYPTLDQPTHFMESYYPDIRFHEDQTQAAYLLILLNLISPAELIEPYDMAPAKDLRRIGLSRDLYNFKPSMNGKLSLNRIRQELKLVDETYDELPSELLRIQKVIARRVASKPSVDDIAALAAISFVHPDPLIRIAAAPLLILLTDGVNEALEELRRGTSLKDDRLSLIAATLLARLSVKDSALDRLKSPTPKYVPSAEKPKTTVLVHGTWASKQTWWQNGYRFFEYLEHDVPIDDLYLGSDRYAWSGDWDHDERVIAASNLINWATQHQETCLNVVAHSHGANIALLASNSFLFGRLILLSTPVHSHRYSPGPPNYTEIFSLRVHLDLVVLADGGGNRFPNWDRLDEEYIGWFNHSATHKAKRWEREGVPSQLPSTVCPQNTGS